MKFSGGSPAMQEGPWKLGRCGLGGLLASSYKCFKTMEWSRPPLLQMSMADQQLKFEVLPNFPNFPNLQVARELS